MTFFFPYSDSKCNCDNDCEYVGDSYLEKTFRLSYSRKADVSIVITNNSFYLNPKHDFFCA